MQFGQLKRREVVSLLGGAVAAWPVVARGEAKVWRVGFVAGGARPVPFESGPYIGFAQGMRDLGYVEGDNLTIEWRFAESRFELFSEFSREFARLRLDVIVTALARLAVTAMREMNPDTPIVVGYGIDIVGLGVVSSLTRPGGNTTGLESALDEVVAKQLDLLVTTVPAVSRIAVLNNPAALPIGDIVLRGLASPAKQAAITLLPVRAQTPLAIETAFDTMTKERADALIVTPDALFVSNRNRIAQLALEHRLPTMFGNREYAQAGGLMSYGDSLQEFYRRSATYVHMIFRGAKPADLPIERPNKFHLAINRKTANALGITFPPLLYIFADEVIE